jgi:hypothetical protein
MMRVQIHLRFTADVESKEEAWLIVDGLEAAAVRKDFIGVSAWVEESSSRDALLRPEGSEPLVSAAEVQERVSGLQPTAVGVDGAPGLSPAVFGQQD